ncbi:MAG: thioredoxin [Clostridiales bacterium 43-6]|nr:MAG: thioredoxin [Clostridiales bacterium 43-6]
MNYLTESNFKEFIEASEKPVLVDFWAEWCAPCRMLGPIFEEMNETYGSEAVFAKVNIDEESSLAIDHFVQSIPTVLIFKDGKEAARLIGVQPKDEYVKYITE